MVIKFNVYLTAEQLRKLRVIGGVSLGKPDVSSLIRDAIDGFLAGQSEANPVIKRALNVESTPRLIRRVVPAASKAGSGGDI